MLANRPQATAPALNSTLQNMDMMREAIEKRASETLATEGRAKRAANRANSRVNAEAFARQHREQKPELPPPPDRASLTFPHGSTKTFPSETSYVC